MIHYVGVRYREGVLWRGVSAKRGSTVVVCISVFVCTSAMTLFFLCKNFTNCCSITMATQW